jgi:serine/threonine protein kinase
MADVFLSYAHADHQFVAQLVEHFRKNGISCFWDKELEPGVRWNPTLETQLNAATSVIVVWSKISYNSEFVMSEANRGLEAGKLFQVSLDGSRVPLGFDGRQYVKVDTYADFCSNKDLSRLIEKIESRKPREDPRTNTLRLVLDRYFGVTLGQYLTKGETGEIWLGTIGFRTVTVKVVRGFVIEQAVGNFKKEKFKSMLKTQLNDLKSLNRRHYLRIYDLKHIPSDLPQAEVDDRLYSKLDHLKDDWIVVSDYTPGIGLNDLARAWAKAGNPVSHKPTISDKTISIVRQLAAALSEAESHNMQLMRLTPQDIFVELNQQGECPLVRFAPLSITQLVEYVSKTAKWTDESSPYIAPELWIKKLPLFAKTSAKTDRLSERIDGANQFALGMIILFILKGEFDFKSDSDDAPLAIIGRFERWVRDNLPVAVDYSSLLSGKPRALYRIIERLVRFNPNERWESMDRVNLLLAALPVDSDRADLFKAVKDVYRKVCVSPDGTTPQLAFYKTFYAKLFHSNEKLKKLFCGINWDRQLWILHEALGQLINFRVPHGGEPTTLTRFILPHKNLSIKLSRDDYEVFGKTLVDTFDDCMQFYPKSDRDFYLAAIDLVIWPGIDYFIENCCEPRQPALSPAAAGPRAAKPRRHRAPQ